MVGYNTVLFINDDSFIQCKRLILSIPERDLAQDRQLDSIDEAAEIYDHSIHDHEVFREGEESAIETNEDFSLLSPEEEFWGHCSNLQVWAEHDYNTRLLKANLSFPLLEALAKAGDSKANVRLKEEIIERINSGYEPVIEYLFMENYLEYLTNEELFFNILNSKESEVLLYLQKKIGIEFKLVPNFEIELEDKIINKDNEWVNINRKFTVEKKHIKELDLSDCNYEQILDLLNELRQLKVLNLVGNLNISKSSNFIERLKELNFCNIIFIDHEIINDNLGKLMNSEIHNIKPIKNYSDLAKILCEYYLNK